MTGLHCNWLPCRKVLEHGHAVVTTCSHIFCLDCANELFTQQLVCPACHQELGKEGDVVTSCLDPDETYRSTILAGLSPSVIMDIAASAMKFWTYQTSQESAYQALVVKNKDAKLAQMDEQLRITQGRLESMSLQGASERSANHQEQSLPFRRPNPQSRRALATPDPMMSKHGRSPQFAAPPTGKPVVKVTRYGNDAGDTGSTLMGQMAHQKYAYQSEGRVRAGSRRF